MIIYYHLQVYAVQNNQIKKNIRSNKKKTTTTPQAKKKKQSRKKNNPQRKNIIQTKKHE